MTNRTDTIQDAPDGWYRVLSWRKSHYYRAFLGSYHPICNHARSSQGINLIEKAANVTDKCKTCQRKLEKLETSK